MKRASIIVTILLALCLAGSASAANSYVPKPGHKCRTGYVRKVRHVKRHGKRIRKVRCVKRAPKVKAVHLAAHLDPTFVQDENNPFSLDFFYSASAAETLEVGGKLLTQEAESLPEGVLSFYLDGSLECAINVGGSNKSGNCGVVVDEMGAHKAITTYTSGSLSSTVTEIENVYPVATTSTLTAEYEQFPQSESTSKGWKVGKLNLHASITPAPGGTFGNFSDLDCEVNEMPACIKVPYFPMALPHPIFDKAGNQIVPVPVYMQETGGEPEVKIDAMALGSSSGDVHWWPLAEIENGSHYLRVKATIAPGYTGAATTAVLRFSPHIIP